METSVSKNLTYCPGLDSSLHDSTIQFESLNKKVLKDVKNETENEIQPKPTKEYGMFEFKTKIVWFNAIGFLFMHIVGIYSLKYVFEDVFNGKFASLSWLLLMTFLGGQGILSGAHRLWTHRSFKATLPLEIFLIVLQTLAGQNCCYVWARDHRQHHKYSDTDADPHNAKRGFFFSHVGWLMMKKHPDVISKGKGINMSDLEANPIIMFQKKYYKSLYFLIAMVIPIGTPILLWNEEFWRSVLVNFFSRYVILLNLTWSVNSVAHMFGTKPYDKNIQPVESYFVSFITLGEGWHNYHHVFPWDYKAAEFGKNLNFTSKLIELWAKIGWAYDLKEASHNIMVKRIQRSGDGTHPVFCTTNYSEEVDQKVFEQFKLKHLGEEIDSEEEISKEVENCDAVVKDTKVNSEEGIRNRIREVTHG